MAKRVDPPDVREPATRILPSPWMTTSAAPSWLPDAMSVLTRPSPLKGWSSVPSVFSRATAKSPSTAPATTILPFPCTATARADSARFVPKVRRTRPSLPNCPSPPIGVQEGDRHVRGRTVTVRASDGDDLPATRRCDCECLLRRGSEIGGDLSTDSERRVAVAVGQDSPYQEVEFQESVIWPSSQEMLPLPPTATAFAAVPIPKSWSCAVRPGANATSGAPDGVSFRTNRSSEDWSGPASPRSRSEPPVVSEALMLEPSPGKPWSTTPPVPNVESNVPAEVSRTTPRPPPLVVDVETRLPVGLRSRVRGSMPSVAVESRIPPLANDGSRAPAAV